MLPSIRLTRLITTAIALTLLGLAGAPPAIAKPLDPKARAEYIRSHYTKTEHRIPMRDGKHLFTAVYTPNDLEGGPWPILLFRTPYGLHPYGADRYKPWLGPHADFETAQFIFAFQDVRGRYMSEGEFVNMRPHNADKREPTDVDESTDTYDTIEWLVTHLDNDNGKVGQWGVSYPGFYTAAGAIDSHPALAAISPQAPIANWWWDDMHRHGAFVLPLAFNFLSAFGQERPEPTAERAEPVDHGTVDGYRFFHELGPLSNVNRDYFEGEIDFWNDLAAHPNYDAFWQARDLVPHLENINAAVMVVGGWFDMEDLYGPLAIYRSIEEKNPDAWNTLVMGPWRHGGWVRSDGENLAEADFGFKTGTWYREHIDLAFFEHFLKGKPAPNLPEALVFETGANRWRSFDQWPPAAATRQKLYFHSDGRLVLDQPPAPAPDQPAADTYPSDPNKPVPYTTDITTRWNPTFMVEDQRFAAWRPDVLVYEGPVLEEDWTAAGPIIADLWVSTTGQDSDFVVKVIDVFPPEHPEADNDATKKPQGYRQQLVRGEVFRGRFRNSYEHPEPFVPGEPTRVRFELWDVLHTWKRGHRIMIQVQSSWFPLVDRNPQSWVENIFEAQAEDFIRVENQLFRSSDYPSHIEIGVLPGPGASKP